MTVSEDIELSVVLPCLNEAETLAGCIEAARQGMASSSVKGEIVIADNGSTDGSQQISTEHGARPVDLHEHQDPGRPGKIACLRLEISRKYGKGRLS